MYFSQKFYILWLVLFCFFSCTPEDSQSGQDSIIDLAGYVVEDIPGSQRKMVTKLTPQGLLEEQGMVEDGKKVGTWTSFFPSNAKAKEIWNFEAGKLNGLHFILNNAGRVDMYESYMNNQLHGKRVTFKQGTPVEEMSYKNGKLNGIFRGFYPTGKLQRLGYFKDGLQDGQYIVYGEDKKIMLQAHYTNGVQDK